VLCETNHESGRLLTYNKQYIHSAKWSELVPKDTHVNTCINILMLNRYSDPKYNIIK